MLIKSLNSQAYCVSAISEDRELGYRILFRTAFSDDFHAFKNCHMLPSFPSSFPSSLPPSFLPSLPPSLLPLLLPFFSSSFPPSLPPFLSSAEEWTQSLMPPSSAHWAISPDFLIWEFNMLLRYLSHVAQRTTTEHPLLAQLQEAVAHVWRNAALPFVSHNPRIKKHRVPAKARLRPLHYCSWSFLLFFGMNATRMSQFLIWQLCTMCKTLVTKRWDSS